MTVSTMVATSNNAMATAIAPIRRVRRFATYARRSAASRSTISVRSASARSASAVYRPIQDSERQDVVEDLVAHSAALGQRRGHWPQNP